MGLPLYYGTAACAALGYVFLFYCTVLLAAQFNNEVNVRLCPLIFINQIYQACLLNVGRKRVSRMR